MFNRPMIAIDIGSSAVKVVELTGAKQKKLSAIGLEVLPPGAVVDGQLQSPEVVEQVLSELLKRLKINPRGRRVALSLGGSSVIIKKLNVQGSKDRDVSEAAYYEAEQQFQIDMAELEFDHVNLSGRSKKDETSPVVAVGAKREMIEQYLTLVRALGMRTGCVECDVFSAANMFEYNYGTVEGLMALVNIGAAATQVSLIFHGDYLFTRDVAIAGEEYTRQIMQALGVARENADGLKVAVSQATGGVPPEVQKIVGTINEQLAHEIQVTIDYFFQSGEAPAGTGLAGVFLTGGGSRTLGLDVALAAALQIPVQVVNPFQRVEINPKRFQLDYILAQGHLYGVAVGLAMRALDDK